ncbi:MAG TPA: DUF2782 domain-containing protein [Rhodocyclaceae bacterium]|nr:DUF2782 domain-containing protein [Rhodocyclaceae bacterium]
MRRLLSLAFFVFAMQAVAQTPLPKLEPLPEPPPPPPGMMDESLEPQITIKRRGEDKIEEYRINGKFYMVKVTPPHGVSYYLIDDNGSGNWVRQEITSPNLRVPMWVVGSF